MINWDDISNFSPGEFSEDPDRYAEPRLIYTLQSYRGIVGEKMYPSPASGALARFNGSDKSQHYAIDRKSTAIDVFVEGDILRAWLLAINTNSMWGGIGLYPYTTKDGKHWPMLHLDIRSGKTKTIWMQDEAGEYHYPMNDSVARKELVTELSKFT